MRKSYQVDESIFDLRHPEIKKVRVEFTNGILAEVMNLGGIIRSLEVPDRNGKKENVVLSYASVDRYIKDESYVGCVVGRYANRINKGRFKLNGIDYQLSVNHESNHLHGGFNAFNKQVWNILSVDKLDESVVINLHYLSPDGEQGYSGNLEVIVKYIISKDYLEIEYEAVTDKDTIFNPTNHSYFNLSGNFKEAIDNHWLQIGASRRLVVDEELIPNGDFSSIKGSTYDFIDAKLIGDHQFDICYELESAAFLRHEESGREMKVKTTFPGLQLYTADYLEEAGLLNRSGVCLETQFFPDSPNHLKFPTTILRRDDVFTHKTTYSFKVKSVNR